GSAEAISAALRDAGIASADVDWVYAHGTGSQANDLAEGIAVPTVFGADSPPVSSTKAIHGHALGACGALETVIAVPRLLEQKMPATFNLKNPDPAIPIRHVKSQPAKIRNIVKNTLGFGGTNAALVLGAVK